MNTRSEHNLNNQHKDDNFVSRNYKEPKKQPFSLAEMFQTISDSVSYIENTILQ